MLRRQFHTRSMTQRNAHIMRNDKLKNIMCEYGQIWNDSAEGLQMPNTNGNDRNIQNNTSERQRQSSSSLWTKKGEKSVIIN